MPATATTLLPLERFTLDRSLTARSERDRDPEVIRHYAQRIESGDAFPPVVAFTDGQRIYLIDGWLRYLAAKQLGRNAIEVDLRTGSRREMRLFGCQTNVAHGVGRSPADRRLAALMALEECPDWTVRQIADHCRVSTSLVSGLVEVRARMPSLSAAEAAARPARVTLGKPVPPRSPDRSTDPVQAPQAPATAAAPAASKSRATMPSNVVS